MFCAANSDSRARKEVIKVPLDSITQSFQPFSLCMCPCVHVRAHTLLLVGPHCVLFSHIVSTWGIVHIS